MNKSRFLACCKSALSPERLRVEVSQAYREIYPQVFLVGEWGSDREHVYQTQIALYTPQWRKEDFRTWGDTCDKRAVKFQRWLREFQAEANHEQPKQVRPVPADGGD